MNCELHSVLFFFLPFPVSSDDEEVVDAETRVSKNWFLRTDEPVFLGTSFYCMNLRLRKFIFLFTERLLDLGREGRGIKERVLVGQGRGQEFELQERVKEEQKKFAMNG